MGNDNIILEPVSKSKIIAREMSVTDTLLSQHKQVLSALGIESLSGLGDLNFNLNNIIVTPGLFKLTKLKANNRLYE